MSLKTVFKNFYTYVHTDVCVCVSGLIEDRETHSEQVRGRELIHIRPARRKIGFLERYKSAQLFFYLKQAIEDKREYNLKTNAYIFFVYYIRGFDNILRKTFLTG